MTKNFYEFDVYQKSLTLSKLIFKLLNNPIFDKEFEFKNQIKRASISVSNTIAEGSEYNSNKQFVRFLTISKGSCPEVRSMSYLAIKLEFISDNEDTIAIIKLTEDISKNISRFIEYLKKNIKQSQNL